jgi:hypothetical protein
VLLQLQNTNGNLASLEIDVDEIGSEIVLKTDAQGNIAQFRLDSDQVESSISLNADQIDVQGKTTFRSALVDEGIETQSGAQSKASEARVLAINTSLEAIATDLGYDDFQSMTINAQQGETIIDGGFLRTSLIQVDNLLAENVFSKDVVITGQLTMSSQAFIQSDDFQSGVLGFKIDSLGNAEFQDVIIGGNDSIIGNQAKLEDLDITGTLSLLQGGELKATDAGNSVTLDSDGITGFDNELGTTFRLPTNGDKPTFSSGVINETIYEISTSAVLRTSETALDGGSNSAGVLINNTGIFAGEANQNTGNANVRIKADGTATFKGEIQAESGAIIGDLSIAESSPGVGGTIRSDVFTQGVEGFIIRADGSAEFNSMSLRTGGYLPNQSGVEIDGDDLNVNGTITIGDAEDTGSGGTIVVLNPVVGEESSIANGSGDDTALKIVSEAVAPFIEARGSTGFTQSFQNVQDLDSSKNEKGVAFSMNGFLGNYDVDFLPLNGANLEVDIQGTLSKSSGSFKIDHPIKPDTHHLVHSFTESPQADLIYRGKAVLDGGEAVIYIDEHVRMTSGTFVALCRNVQVFTSNETSWHRVRGRVDGASVIVECEDPNCTDEISWLVVAERKDDAIYQSRMTDDNGKVILEPEKDLNSNTS